MCSCKCRLLFKKKQNYNEAHVDVKQSFLKAVSVVTRPWKVEDIFGLDNWTLSSPPRVKPRNACVLVAKFKNKLKGKPKSKSGDLPHLLCCAVYPLSPNLPKATRYWSVSFAGPLSLGVTWTAVKGEGRVGSSFSEKLNRFLYFINMHFYFVNIMIFCCKLMRFEAFMIFDRPILV